MATSPHHPIAIVGGGLGGLTTAATLHARSIPAVIFELEAGRQVRAQGGMLDIHEENGQQALRAAGLFNAFLTKIHRGGEAMRILDRHATALREEEDDGGQERPEIDRGTLRDLLLDALPDGTVHWNRKVTSVRPLEGATGRHEVKLADGTSFTTDLLIGADGAWSRVRPLVSDALPAYTGISFIEVDLHDADARHPAQAAAMGAGMLFALGGDTGILGHRETDNSLHVYLGHRCPEDWVDTIDFTDTPTAKAAVLGLIDGWDESLRGLIANADTPLIPRRINALPIGHRWERVPGVTLLGDAAHVMSPFAGEGANLAMFDGAQLAFAIAAQPQDTEAALAAYESELFPRAEDSARASANNLQVIFAPDAPRGLLQQFAHYDQPRAANDG
jgi:2-polyprenyl-6-methoxyphenol hydroxylase-like FAD-dependent oxidoreductase